MIEARIAQISEAYSVLPQLEFWDLTLDEVMKPAEGRLGHVNVILKRGNAVFERVILITDDLGHIAETFNYSEYITPLSCDISLNGLKMAYFDNLGHLITERKDTTEVFRVKPAQRERIEEILKEKLGKLFHV